MERYERVCPVEYAGGLDSRVRKLLQDPAKMLDDHVREGMVVLELGCGSGYFTPEIARRAGPSGKVVAADLQEGMLDLVRAKIKGTALEGRVTLHKCEADRIGLAEKVDLVLAFFMVHEVPDRRKLLREIRSLLNPGGRVYVLEFRMHPPKRAFDEMVRVAREEGLVEAGRTSSLLSRGIVLE